MIHYEIGLNFHHLGNAEEAVLSLTTAMDLDLDPKDKLLVKDITDRLNDIGK